MNEQQLQELIAEIRSYRHEMQLSSWQRLKAKRKASSSKARAATKQWLYRMADKL